MRLASNQVAAFFTLKWCGVVLFACCAATALAQDAARATPAPTTTVKRTADFAVTGSGDAAQWRQAEWISLHRRSGGTLDYEARFKVLYSESGIYFLLNGTDKTLTATLDDFDDLWTEDVFEFFLWTDPGLPIYFEYEISPLNKELPILIPNIEGTFLGWRPWKYGEGERTQKKVHIAGGEMQSGASIEGWTAEVFVPYALLRPLANVPPKSGSTWRANVYRVDHDGGASTAWDWSRVGPSFHEYQKFGKFVFE